MYLFAIIFLLIFVAYYLTFVVQKPQFFCDNGKFRDFLLQNCPSIKEHYWPPIWCFYSYLLTPVSSIFRSTLSELNYEREYVPTMDGGQISLDWYIAEDDLKPESYLTRSIIIFFPGLTGCSQAEYIRSMIPLAHKCGYRPVALNYRGMGNTKLLNRRLYCGANSEDLCTALKHLKKHNPESKLIAVGVSLGGMLLGHYLISSSSETLLDAAILLSNCWNSLEAAENMANKKHKFILNRVVTKSLIGIVLQHKEWFVDSEEFDLEIVSKCRSMKEFDQEFTIKMFKFDNITQYYLEANHSGKIDRITIPVLSINAADDMLAPTKDLPIDEIERSNNVAMVLTSHGGHIGFMEGPFGLLSRSYYAERVIEQFLVSLHNFEGFNK